MLPRSPGTKTSRTKKYNFNSSTKPFFHPTSSLPMKPRGQRMKKDNKFLKILFHRYNLNPSTKTFLYPISSFPMKLRGQRMKKDNTSLKLLFHQYNLKPSTKTFLHPGFPMKPLGQQMKKHNTSLKILFHLCHHSLGFLCCRPYFYSSVRLYRFYRLL